ncbi:hypothetical protein ACH5RR_026047 [Cinchona calisaya]|uniref:Uncharacterized protein n=1 Tax=Cinchona calisaya TaxID=153742 RepID=A0ABD2Z4S8_9GENT
MPETLDLCQPSKTLASKDHEVNDKGDAKDDGYEEGVTDKADTSAEKGDIIINLETREAQEFWGTTLQKFCAKPKWLKLDFKTWNKVYFGDIFLRLRTTDDEVASPELLAEQRPSQDNLIEFSRLKACLMKSIAEKDSFWKQKVGIKLLKEMDHNTTYFHSNLTTKRNKLCIRRLKNPSGQWIQDQVFLEEETLDLFSVFSFRGSGSAR